MHPSAAAAALYGVHNALFDTWEADFTFPHNNNQGCARDLSGRDRDETRDA